MASSSGMDSAVRPRAQGKTGGASDPALILCDVRALLIDLFAQDLTRPQTAAEAAVV